MSFTAYGSITPTQAAYSAKTLLERAVPFLILEQIGQMKPLPANNTKTINFRRHKLAPVANQIGAQGDVLPTGGLSQYALSEGVTPTELSVVMQNVDVTLQQYGAVVAVSDVTDETHIDDVLTEYMGILGENAGQVIELMRWEALRTASSTNVLYSGSASSDATVALTVDTGKFRAAVRSIRANHGRPITKVVKSDVRYGTQACEPSFVAVMHSDMEGTIRKALGANFTPVADYGQNATPLQGEFGNFENIRFLSSTILGKRSKAGQASSGAATMFTDGVSGSSDGINLYDILVFGADAWAGIALKGEFAVTPTLVRATPSESDPLAQRSKAGYKTMQACTLLQSAHVKKIVTCAYNDANLT